MKEVKMTMIIRCHGTMNMIGGRSFYTALGHTNEMS